jgi:hypothetical protein
MRSIRTLAAILSALVLLGGSPRALTSHAVQVWFTPAPGSLDMLALFQHPEEWTVALSRVAVFKFYQAQLMSTPVAEIGPNTYQALNAIDAFRTLTLRWRKSIAIEVGVVKPQYCTADSSGLAMAIRDSLNAVNNVRAGGGDVAYLAMDEPFFAGAAKACGGPDPSATVQRLTQYVEAMKQSFPSVRVGLIEPYPYFGGATIVGLLARMTASGIGPAFFHLDIDISALKPGRDDLVHDLALIASACATTRTPFGVIVWGVNGDSDALYADDALHLARTLGAAFLAGDLWADHVIFQSWAVSSTGLLITPTNLPETTPDTHTGILNAAFGVWSTQLAGHEQPAQGGSRRRP